MLDAVQRGLQLYWEGDHWKSVMKNAFNTDCSWKRSAVKYASLYESMLEK